MSMVAMAAVSVEEAWPAPGTLLAVMLLAGGSLGLLSLAGRWWRYRRLRRRYRAVLRAEGLRR